MKILQSFLKVEQYCLWPLLVCLESLICWCVLCKFPQYLWPVPSLPLPPLTTFPRRSALASAAGADEACWSLMNTLRGQIPKLCREIRSLKAKCSMADSLSLLALFKALVNWLELILSDTDLRIRSTYYLILEMRILNIYNGLNRSYL